MGGEACDVQPTGKLQDRCRRPTSRHNRRGSSRTRTERHEHQDAQLLLRHVEDANTKYRYGRGRDGVAHLHLSVCTIDMKPGSGVLQGSSTASGDFIRVYSQAIDEWAAETLVPELVVVSPLTGNVLDLSNCTYVDDLGKTTTPNTAQELADSTKDSDLKLDKCLKNTGAEQNTKKKKIMVHFLGRGSLNSLRKVQCSTLKVCRSANDNTIEQKGKWTCDRSLNRRF
mmetsp:Transcript_13179/g.34807  ORF Transcript_13179/g.34807 Transcript_13179/m.34807 type:complete len:227 (-) Transcript_13179:269-949(-)